MRWLLAEAGARVPISVREADELTGMLRPASLFSHAPTTAMPEHEVC
jgi:hypothetical protein